MTAEAQIKAQMQEKASQLSVEDLKEQILKDLANPSLPDVVFEVLLAALESKLSEEDFLAFCEELDK